MDPIFWLVIVCSFDLEPVGEVVLTFLVLFD